MKKMKALQIIAAAMAVTVAATSAPVNVFAYGETSASSTLFTDTQNISDYATWKDNVWNKKDDQGNLTGEGESYDSSRIILTPGKTAKDLGFAWYSQKKGEPAVKIGKKEDLSDAQEFKGTATEINRSNQKNTYKASNKVTVEGLFEENTTYYYSYTDDVKNPNWSEVQSYTTKKTTNFQTILVGDPQIGASGSQGQGTADDINIAVDTFNWNKTLEQAKITAPNASFILSAGDQIDYAGTDSSDGKNVRESEYAGFTYPALLRMLPLATTIGNHESKGTDYKYHYNNPNSEDGLGSTNSGSDYYFSYGNVLFISLNSNNRNTVEHRELLKKAVESTDPHYGETDNGIVYQFDGETLTLSKDDSIAWFKGDVEIPVQYKGELNGAYTLVQNTADDHLFDRENYVYPWDAFAGEIKHIVFEDDFDTLNNWEFYDCVNLESFDYALKDLWSTSLPPQITSIYLKDSDSAPRGTFAKMLHSMDIREIRRSSGAWRTAAITMWQLRVTAHIRLMF